MQPLREGLCNSEYSELCIKTRIAFFGNLYLEAWPLQLGHAHRLRSDFENRGILRNFCLRKPCLCCLETEFQRKQGSWHGWLQIVSYATFFMAIWITTLTDLTTTLLSRLLSIEDEHDTGLPAYSDGAGLGH